jgi:hypothetical protein
MVKKIVAKLNIIEQSEELKRAIAQEIENKDKNLKSLLNDERETDQNDSQSM